MPRPLALGAGLLLGAALVAGPAAPASAQTAPVCDAYSGACATPPASTPVDDVDDTGVLGTSVSTGTGGAATEGDLPFTGGEAVMIGLLGVGALAGGTALVVAGRRRADGSPA